VSWSADFVTRISASRIAPIYVVQSIALPGETQPMGGDLLLASSRAIVGSKPVLTPEGSRISYGALQVREWSYTTAEWEIGLLSQDLGGYDVRHFTTRGQAVALKIGFSGWKDEQFETVALGIVQDVESNGGAWTIRVRSILSMLASRNSTTTAEQSLFHLLDESTIATGSGGYAAGAATVSITGGSTPYERESTGVNRFAVRITPDDPDAEPFIVTATGISAGPPTGLTGVSATAILGGTVNDAAEGNRVEILAYTQGHPFTVARKILTSTGVAAANGAYDTLPASWGMAFPVEHVDGDDIDMGADYYSPNAAPAAVWDVFADAAQEDALSWLQAVLAPMGAFVCERQGAITVRAAAVHFNQPGVLLAWDVYDDELVSVDSYSAYDGSTPVEYSQVRIRDSHGDETDFDDTDGEEVGSRPVLGRYLLELPYVDTDRTDWRELVRDMVGPYYTRIGEPVVITCRGWRMAQAAPGDHVHVYTSSRFLSGRRRGLGLDISNGAAMLITSVEPDWFGSTVRIRCQHLTDAPSE
jgi:hypothetical protein